MIEEVTRKSFIIRPSGRSSDYISPSFGFGCLLNCSYCYMKRHKPEGVTISKNIDDILTAINNHSVFDTIEKPNQTDDKYITYDISCNEDFALHYKYYDWIKIFDFFKYHPIAKATFATKIIPYQFLSYNPEEKVRIRFSITPEYIRHMFEPKTAASENKIFMINNFIEAGYDVHINFSPVIIYNNWISDYQYLFGLLDKTIHDDYKEKVKAEVIFLTHNIKKHEYNLNKGLPGEDLLWRPTIQERKISQYGGENVRYKVRLKDEAIKTFTQIHDNIIPWNTIRYIF